MRYFESGLPSRRTRSRKAALPWWLVVVLSPLSVGCLSAGGGNKADSEPRKTNRTASDAGTETDDGDSQDESEGRDGDDSPGPARPGTAQEADASSGNQDPANEPGKEGGAGSPPSDAPTPDDDTPADPERPKTPPGDVLFQPGQLLQVDITASADVITAIEQYGNEEVYHPASAQIRGMGVDTGLLAEIGLRHKGNWSLHHCWDEFGGVRSYAAECSKLSYKIKFHEYDPDLRLDGVKRLNLHAVSGEPSKMRDMIAYQTFRSFGIDAPRTAPARVTINGEVAGLFIAVEAIDGRYTASRYPEGGDGNLFKEIWPNALAEEADFIEALRTNDEEPDVSDMLAFTQAIATATTDDFADHVARWVEVPQLLRYIAVDRALKNWDGIMAFYLNHSPHNFYWYHDDGPEDRFHLIPWDLDNTIWEFDPYMAPEQWATAAPIPNWNEEPLNCNPRPVWTEDSDVSVVPPRCDALLDRLAELYWDAFVVFGEELLAGPMSAPALDEQIAHWSTVLEPLVADDPTLSLEEWYFQVEELGRFTQRARQDFRAFLDEGLIDESSAQPVEPSPVDPPTALDGPTTDDGLHVGAVTNFEFPGVFGAEPAGVFTVNADNSVVNVFWNDVAPLSGTADMRAEFTFDSGPDAYDEWVNIGIVNETADVRSYGGIRMTVRADVPRTVRIRLLSDAYDELWGGIWTEFGGYYEVGTAPTEFVFAFADQVYPDWAKDSWEADQGFTTSDAAALQQALASFTGILFNPEPSWDGDGNLQQASESGFLQIDNLAFE